MILSMTGYGTGSCQSEGTSIVVEVRSVNHRFLDLHVRLPREYSYLENDVQKTVKESLHRGRVDVTITIQQSAPAGLLLNIGAARGYVEAVAGLRDELGFQEPLDLKTLLSLPGVLQGRDVAQESAEAEKSPVREAVIQSVRQAVDQVLEMRRQEGASLASELLNYLGRIGEKSRLISSQTPKMIQDCHDRLRERLGQLLAENLIDPQRIAQEVALLAEKSDISEELTRLDSHLSQFRALVAAGQEVGKKMDFLLQEMQRESNTILSKSGSVEITCDGLAIKADIEKLREQVQNIE
jgi:uncharacterized protein (TIGR00255 family)